MLSVYITAPPEAADDIAATLVKERLTACVNSASFESVYRWKGDVQTDKEEILLAKTTERRYTDLRD